MTAKPPKRRVAYSKTRFYWVKVAIGYRPRCPKHGHTATHTMSNRHHPGKGGPTGYWACPLCLAEGDMVIMVMDPPEAKRDA